MQNNWDSPSQNNVPFNPPVSFSKTSSLMPHRYKMRDICGGQRITASLWRMVAWVIIYRGGIRQPRTLYIPSLCSNTVTLCPARLNDVAQDNPARPPPTIRKCSARGALCSSVAMSGQSRRRKREENRAVVITSSRHAPAGDLEEIVEEMSIRVAGNRHRSDDSSGSSRVPPLAL